MAEKPEDKWEAWANKWEGWLKDQAGNVDEDFFDADGFGTLVQDAAFFAFVSGATVWGGPVAGFAASLLAGYMKGGGDDDKVLQKLKQLEAKLNFVSKKIDEIKQQIVEIEHISPILANSAGVTQELDNFLSDINAGTKLDNRFDKLTTALAKLDDVLVNALVLPDGQSWKGNFTPGSYKNSPGWDHASVYAPFNWGLQKRYNVVEATHVPDEMNTTGQRPDHRLLGWAVLRGLWISLIGHLVLDPAERTNGRHRKTFTIYAEALRHLARHILGGIKVARPISLPADYTSWYWGNPSPEKGGPPYRILAMGWPVGAVDTVTGAHCFERYWRPADHGFPELAGALSWKAEDVGLVLQVKIWQAIQAAQDWTHEAWAKVVLHSGALELIRLANRFEALASPPDHSETVAVLSETWWSHRKDAGTRTLHTHSGWVPEIAKLLPGCPDSSYEAKVTHIDQKVVIKLRIQPERYRHWDDIPNEGKSRDQKIQYRYFLETPSLGQSGLTTLPFPKLHPPDNQRHELTAKPGEGLVSLTFPAPTFTYVQPIIRLSPPSIPPRRRDWEGGPDVHSWQVEEVMGYIEQKVILVTPSTWVSGAGTIDRGVRLFPAGMANVTLKYQREDADGEVTFTFVHDGGNPNTVVWLVVDEPVGAPRAADPEYFRTGVRMSFVGEELAVSVDYFNDLDACAKAYENLWKNMNKNVPIEDGPPIPDPQFDHTLPDYLTRLNQYLSRRVE